MQSIKEKKNLPKSKIALRAALPLRGTTKDKKAKGKQRGLTVPPLPLRGKNKGLQEKKNRTLLLPAKPVAPSALSVGDFCELKITALGPKGVGIAELSSQGYALTILIPNAQLGETVKAQIIKLHLKKAKYAVAKKVSVLNTPFILENKDAKLPPMGVGDILTVKLNHMVFLTPDGGKFIGIVDSDLNLPTPLGYQLLIPLNNAAQVGQEIKIQVTRIKLKYGFAKIVAPYPSGVKNVPLRGATDQGEALNGTNLTPLNLTPRWGGKGGINNLPYPSGVPDITPLPLRGKNKGLNNRNVKLTKGSKITFTLPKTAKKYAKHIVMLLFFPTNAQGEALRGTNHNPSPLRGDRAATLVLFIKNQLGAKLGDQVRVKFTQIGSTFAIGKVVRISPNSSLKKMALAKKNINEMLLNGMHYGEKVVKCQARMRNYIWNRKKGQLAPIQSINKGLALIKKGRHLINLLKTRRCLNIGLNQLTRYAAKGRTFLFVGTQKPAAGLIARAALFSKTSFFVNTRWLGGMLTNWKTIVKSIVKIRPILKEKQKVIANILQKRAKIQNRLIKKVLSLRKKSTILIKKGKQLIAKVSGTAWSGSKIQNDTHTQGETLSGLKKSEQLNSKRKELFERGQFLLQKRQNLLNKLAELKENTLNIKECGFLIANKYKVLLSLITNGALAPGGLNDIRLLFQLNQHVRQIKKFAKELAFDEYTLSYGKIKELSQLASEKAPYPFGVSTKNFWLIPNPPQKILNKIFMLRIQGAAHSPKGATHVKKIDGSSMFNMLRLKVANTTSFLPLRGRKEKNISSSLKNAPSEAWNYPSGIPLPPVGGRGRIVLTKLLSKFSRFLPYIKNAIQGEALIRINPEGIRRSLILPQRGREEKLKALKANLKNLKIKLSYAVQFKNKINTELELIQKKYTSEQQIIRILRRKLKRHEAEKKLLQFLPKLRYLPTPKSQISLAIQLLMKRFVDPKMKYPMDLIYDDKLKKKSKKVAAARKKKWQRLETYFGGIANMTKFKKTQISKNVAIIIGQQEEMNAVRECKKLGIKMFHIVDTNCNPGLADHFIPSNDNSQNSIKFILTKIITRIRLAQKIRLRFQAKPGIKNRFSVPLSNI